MNDLVRSAPKMLVDLSRRRALETPAQLGFAFLDGAVNEISSD